MVHVALLARLEAKPGKEDEVAALLKSALPLANAEPATTVWFALKLGPTTFGIFDAFPDDAGRQAHLAGQSRPRSSGWIFSRRSSVTDRAALIDATEPWMSTSRPAS